MQSEQALSKWALTVCKYFVLVVMCAQCGLVECLNNMLLKWLTWHSVYALEDDLDISLNSHTSM